MSAAIAFMSLCVAAAGWYMAWAVSVTNLSLRAELERMKRQKGLAEKFIWIAEVRVPKSKQRQMIRLEVSNEGDAVVQLLKMKVNLSHIVSLQPAMGPATKHVTPWD